MELKPWLWAGEPDCSSLIVAALNWSELGGSADLSRRNHRSGDRSKLVPPPLSGSGRPGALQS